MTEGTRAPLRRSSDGAGPYVIQVRGTVARHWEPELQMRLSYTQTEWGPVSTLSGHLPDQAALLGALGRLAMWGYLIIRVCYDESCEGDDERASARGGPGG